MTAGAGKYDELCTQVREQANADGVVLLIVNGRHGNGFSVQAPIDVHATLPTVLESIAEGIREDWTGDNAGPMTDHHTAAFTLLTLGKAAGMLDREDIRSKVLDALRGGTLNPHYLVKLRDQLTEVLIASRPVEPNA